MKDDGKWRGIGSEDDELRSTSVEGLCSFVSALKDVLIMVASAVTVRSYLLELSVVGSLLNSIQDLL